MDVELETGERAWAASFDGLVLVLEAPRAFPPGSPVRFRAPFEGGTKTLEGRSQGTKRRDDDTFVVRLRLVNLTRASREGLRAAIALSDGGPAYRTPTS